MDFNRSDNLFKNILWLQWIAGMGAMMMMFTLGLMFGWTSPYLAQLTAEDSPLPITTDEASWVASLFNFGQFAGAIIGGVSVQFFDAKQTLVIIGFPLMLGWICIIAANSVIWLYIARAAVGMSLGMSFSSFPLFLGEVSSPTIRGALVSLAMTGLAFGSLVGNIMGPYVSMTVFSCISLVPNIAFTLLFLWIPQSPHYFVRLGRMEDAVKSITRYNRKADTKIELESLRNFIIASESLTYQDRLREFNMPRNRRAALIILLLNFFLHMSGLNSIVFYMELILIAAMVDAIDPAMLVMIASAVGVLSGWSAVYIADKFERKVLVIGSSVGASLALGAFGIHFALLGNGVDPSALQWLPITAVISFTTFVCNGITTVPSMLTSEFFAPNIKNMAASLMSISLGLFTFASTKSYQPLINMVGETSVFCGYAVLMIMGIIFSAIYVPKTKGKSLQEIQNALMRK